MSSVRLILTSCLVVASLGCEVGPKSGRGLSLPVGDIARGEVVFRELGCSSCHDVFGDPAPPDDDRAEVIVTLGGDVTRIETHGELVTSIINPSHEISLRQARERVPDGDVSEMENFNDRMTVTQLIDLTEFLQSKYRIRHEPHYIR